LNGRYAASAGAIAAASSSRVIARKASIIRRLSERLSTRPAFGTSFGFMGRGARTGGSISTTSASSTSSSASISASRVAALMLGPAMRCVVTGEDVLRALPLAMFRRTKLSHANAVAALYQGAYVGFQFIATLYYQTVVGWSAFATGFAFAIGGTCVMFLAPRFATIGQNRGTTLLMTFGVGLQAISYLFWVLSAGHIDTMVLVAISQLLLGVGYAMTYPSIQVAALSDVGDDESGLASGMLFASFQIGGGIILAAASAVFSAAPSFGWNPYIAGIGFVTILAAAITLLAAVGPRSSAARATNYQAAE